MATGTKKGLVPFRKVGSAPNNGGLSTYAIATGYATGLAKGDPVKLHTDGTIIRASNDTADSIGVFMGVSYTDSTGTPKYSPQWLASTTATNIQALVMDDPFATFQAKGEGPIPLVQVGDIFAMNLEDPDTSTGQSQMTVKCLAEITGDVDISAMTDLVDAGGVAGLAGSDAFTIRTTNPDNAAVTITITDPMTPAALLALLNAVDGIEASLSDDGYLNIVATDGYDLTLASTVGAPVADFFAATSFTAESEVVAASAGLVKVISVIDRDTYAMEVVLVDHDLRDDG
jgi:hypothetical protein